MKKIFLALLLLTALPVAAQAVNITLKPSNQYSDTIWYEGGADALNLPWQTNYINLLADVSGDTNLMAFQVHVRYPAAKIQCFRDSVTAGTFLTGSSSDSYFFNVSIETNATFGTLTITGSRMDATAGQKALTGNDQQLATNIRFYRIATTTLLGDSLCVLGGSLKFRDASNGAISTVTIPPTGWYFQAKPWMSDVNSDGTVTNADVVGVRNYRTTSAYTYDVNQDGSITNADVVQSRNERTNTY